MISSGEHGVLKREKFFKLLSNVLPNRSPASCYKFILREYSALNHKGAWSQEEVDSLLALVSKYGRRWKLIGKELNRTKDNVYDKYRSLGEEGFEDRVSNMWKVQ